VTDSLLSDARWVQAERDFVRVHTATGSRLLNMPLSHFVTGCANAGIIRIHRSYAVQIAAVSEIRRTSNRYTVVVDGQALPVSRGAARRGW
jgi:DNA-binding LytR/AlgR family response regulator